MLLFYWSSVDNESAGAASSVALERWGLSSLSTVLSDSFSAFLTSLKLIYFSNNAAKLPSCRAIFNPLSIRSANSGFDFETKKNI